MDGEAACSEDEHFFPVDEDWWNTPGEQPCLCGEVTWQQMDDLRTLTLMWGAS